MQQVIIRPLGPGLKDKTAPSASLKQFTLGGAPTGIRTPVLALKGLRPGPLDDGGSDGHCTILTGSGSTFWAFAGGFSPIGGDGYWRDCDQLPVHQPGAQTGIDLI